MSEKAKALVAETVDQLNKLPESKKDKAKRIYCGVATHDAPAAAQQQPTINIVNTNANTNSNTNVNNNANGPAYVPKQKWVAFFLCLFFGCFGVHRFYVHKTGTGIIWLFTCGLGGIGWLVDLVMILLGAFRDNMGQPLV